MPKAVIISLLFVKVTNLLKFATFAAYFWRWANFVFLWRPAFPFGG
jgi:hypothetical protein